MKTYKAIVSTVEVVEVTAESEEQAIERVKASLPPRTVAEVQIAQEIEATKE